MKTKSTSTSIHHFNNYISPAREYNTCNKKISRFGNRIKRWQDLAKKIQGVTWIRITTNSPNDGNENVEVTSISLSQLFNPKNA